MQTTVSLATIELCHCFLKTPRQLPSLDLKHSMIFHIKKDVLVSHRCFFVQNIPRIQVRKHPMPMVLNWWHCQHSGHIWKGVGLWGYSNDCRGDDASGMWWVRVINATDPAIRIIVPEMKICHNHNTESAPPLCNH